MTLPPLGLADGKRLAGLSYEELWTGYVALGGNGTANQLRKHIENAGDCPDEHEHNVIAQALNETYLDQNRDHPVAYLHLYRSPNQV